MSKIIRMEIDRLDALYANRPDLRIAVIEWRADYYGNIAETANVFNILRHLRTLFPDRLILFTFRSEEQGGEIRNDRVHMGMEDIMRNVVSSGMVDMDRYETGYQLKSAGVLSGYDITTEAALTKLMFLFGQHLSVDEVRQEMMHSIVGEISME